MCIRDRAKVKNVANDFNGMSAAIYGYQDRYKSYPGDDVGATGRWPTSTSGDGNARVGAAANAGVFDCWTSTAENCQFWQHLRFAGFIAGDTASKLSPQNAVGGVLQVQDGALGLSGLVVCSTNLPGKVGNAIDAQFDDGKPETGQVRGTNVSTALQTNLTACLLYTSRCV